MAGSLKEGEGYRLRSGGGGGFGHPHQRPAEKVLDDVRQGYVSIALAADLYGVVIEPTAMAIDVAATQTARSQP